MFGFAAVSSRQLRPELIELRSYSKLFGEDDEVIDTEELDKAQADGENGRFLGPEAIVWLTRCIYCTAEEIENLKKEAAAFRDVRLSLGEEGGPRRVFDKVCSPVHENPEGMFRDNIGLQRRYQAFTSNGRHVESSRASSTSSS